MKPTLKPDERQTRTLFSVVEVRVGDERFFEVEWHPDLYALLDDISPNGEITDKMINLAEELLEDEGGHR